MQFLTGPFSVVISWACVLFLNQEAAIGQSSAGQNLKSNQDWISMFNGKSLEGWTQKNGWANYKVEDKAIVGTTSKGSPNSFLCTLVEYGDFEFEFEVKCDARLNSGVQIRSKTKEDQKGKADVYRVGRVNGPQVEIEASGEKGAEAGYIYGEATGRGWLVKPEDLKPHKRFVDGDWNRYRVVAKGPRIQTYINGELVCDLVDEEIYKTHESGFIGLQVHGVGNQGPFQVRWRNLRIRELK